MGAGGYLLDLGQGVAVGGEEGEVPRDHLGRFAPGVHLGGFLDRAEHDAEGDHLGTGVGGAAGLVGDRLAGVGLIDAEQRRGELVRALECPPDGVASERELDGDVAGGALRRRLARQEAGDEFATHDRR